MTTWGVRVHVPIKPTDVDAALLASRSAARNALIPLLCRKGIHRMRIIRSVKVDGVYQRDLRCSRCHLLRHERSNY